MRDEDLSSKVLQAVVAGNAQAPTVWPSLGNLGGLVFTPLAAAFPQAGLSVKLV